MRVALLYAGERADALESLSGRHWLDCRTGRPFAPPKKGNTLQNRVFQISVSIMDSVRHGLEAKAKRHGGTENIE